MSEVDTVYAVYSCFFSKEVFRGALKPIRKSSKPIMKGTVFFICQILKTAVWLKISNVK